MHVTRFSLAAPYDAPGHADMRMLRLQGREAGPSDTLWIGVSHILPGGGTTLEASGLEKIYVVLDGEVTVTNGTETVGLATWDSCRVAPGEARALSNRTNRIATVLLAMPLAADATR